MSHKTVLSFGHFDPHGGRFWVIRKGLEEAGYNVVFCNTEERGLIGKWRDLKKKWIAYKHATDVIFVPFLGHYLLPLAWKLARRKKIPIVFDAFLSLYDTEVKDRRRVSAFNPWAWILWMTDWLCCRLATVILLDTEEHKQYFVRTFGADPKKILVLPIGCRTDIFRPLPDNRSANHPFTVTFHGTFIPLQGVDTILRAAKILEDRGEVIQVDLIGRGQTWPAMKALAEKLRVRSVAFLPAMTMEMIAHKVAQSDICLGIFGTTDKAKRVIPNKAYEILQCARPLVTARTPASERVLKNGETAVLVEPGTPHVLANAIAMLKSDPSLRRHLGEAGHHLSTAKFQPPAIVQPLVEWLHYHNRISGDTMNT